MMFVRKGVDPVTSDLSRPITLLKGVGKSKADDLKKLNIATVEDILYHFPYRYEDRANLKPIDQLVDNSTDTVIGVVEQLTENFTRNGMRITKASLACETGYITATWFNQKYIKDKLTYGTKIVATGRISTAYHKQLAVQDFEILEDSDQGEDFCRIMPIHRATEKNNAKFIRKLIKEGLQSYSSQVVDYLPLAILKRYGLPTLQGSLREIHFPTSWERLNLARCRLVIDEFLIMLLGLQAQALDQQIQVGIGHAKGEILTNRFLASLPFSLTNGQKKVILEIKKDMEKEQVMQRLVQGDVGSGKTMVAIYTLLKAVEGGYQGALMAPTELLAEQHYWNLGRYLAPLGLTVTLLKGSMTKSEKEACLALIASGDSQIIVGTHALIQQQVIFEHLGVVVIDEQHRFGVKQRIALENKGVTPDVLVMTATPIPRSLALTLYGDMALSVIDELPPGRSPIQTYHIDERKRKKMYQFLAKEIEQGFQVYIVCPLVEESEKMDLEDATALADRLAITVFPQYRIGLLHGRMSAQDKEAVMDGFRLGQIQILVSTTVIEVGVDVPNANVMVIENAERFGLAQLHQLRGRVGRGKTQAYCVLIAQPKTDEGIKRMNIMTSSNDGFVIAEEDLALRGPGEVLGTRQHGLPDFKIANLVSDIKLLEKSKQIAEDILSDGLDKVEYAVLREKIRAIQLKKQALEAST